jgi:hypothetical protein
MNVAGLVFAALLGGGARAALAGGTLILCGTSANGMGDHDVQFVLDGGAPFTVRGPRQRLPDRGVRQPDGDAAFATWPLAPDRRGRHSRAEQVGTLTGSKCVVSYPSVMKDLTLCYVV